jgi:hypothetical protein
MMAMKLNTINNLTGTLIVRNKNILSHRKENIDQFGEILIVDINRMRAVINTEK